MHLEGENEICFILGSVSSATTFSFLENAILEYKYFNSVDKHNSQIILGPVTMHI